MGSHLTPFMVKDVLSFYVPANRTRVLVVAGTLIVVIALVDWRVERYISIGFLYLFPIILLSGLLSRTQIVVLALACAGLQEIFSPELPSSEAVVRLIFSSAGFVGTGLFVSETIRNRRIAQKHIHQLASEITMRLDAEEEMRVLVESSPAAIVTIDLSGKILLANQAAQQLLAPEEAPLEGQNIGSYLPALQTAIETEPSRQFRTALQGRGQRANGEVFMAGIWFSTYATVSGRRLAAIIADVSEELRNREDLSLDHLLKSTRILMGAVAHEVRNLCSAMLVVHRNLSRIKELAHNDDFHALATLIEGLERVAVLDKARDSGQNASTVELGPVLDELRVLIEVGYRESGMEVQWQVPDSLPLVWADRYGLVQVFLNLAKNSQRAMQDAETRRLCVTAGDEAKAVVIRFSDSGVGVRSPQVLFRPFRSGADSTGLGLYVSRAIMRSFGGDLIYEPTPQGCCFLIVVPLLSAVAEKVHA